jgi:hypothetical protein
MAVGNYETLFLSKHNSAVSTVMTCLLLKPYSLAPTPPTRLNAQIFMVSMIVVGDVTEIYYGGLSTGQSRPFKRANKDRLDICMAQPSTWRITRGPSLPISAV